MATVRIAKASVNANAVPIATLSDGVAISDSVTTTLTTEAQPRVRIAAASLAADPYIEPTPVQSAVNDAVTINDTLDVQLVTPAQPRVRIVNAQVNADAYVDQTPLSVTIDDSVTVDDTVSSQVATTTAGRVRIAAAGINAAAIPPPDTLVVTISDAVAVTDDRDQQTSVEVETLTDAVAIDDTLIVTASVEPVVITRSDTWMVRAPASFGRTGTWNVRRAVSRTLTGTWVTASPVGDAFVVVTTANTWRTTGQVTKTFGSTWSVRTGFTNQLGLGNTPLGTSPLGGGNDSAGKTWWNTRTPLNYTFSSTWVVRRGVTKNNQNTWTTKGVVVVTLANTWNIRIPVERSWTATANVRGMTFKFSANGWRTAQAGGIVVLTPNTWGVRAFLTVFPATAVYNVRTPVGKTLATSWQFRSSFTTTKSSTWQVAAASGVARTVATTWNVAQKLTVTFQAVWAVNKQLVFQNKTSWRTYSEKIPDYEWYTYIGQSPRRVEWYTFLNGMWQPVRFGVPRQATPKPGIFISYPVTWKVRRNGGTSFSSTWRVSSGGSKVLGTTWAVRRATAPPALAGRWSVRARQTILLATTWNMERPVSNSNGALGTSPLGLAPLGGIKPIAKARVRLSGAKIGAAKLATRVLIASASLVATLSGQDNFAVGSTEPKMDNPLQPTAADNVGWDGNFGNGTLGNPNQALTQNYTVKSGETMSNRIIWGNVILTDATSRLVNCIVYGGAYTVSYTGLVIAANGGYMERVTIYGTSRSVNYYTNGVKHTGGVLTTNRCVIFRVVDAVHTTGTTAQWIDNGSLLGRYAVFTNDADHATGTPPYWTHNDAFQALSPASTLEHLMFGTSVFSYFDCTGVTWSGGAWGVGTASGGEIGMPADVLNAGYWDADNPGYGTWANGVTLSNVTGHKLKMDSCWIDGVNASSGMIQFTTGTTNKLTMENCRIRLGGKPSGSNKIFVITMVTGSNLNVYGTGSRANRYDDHQSVPPTLRNVELVYSASGSVSIVPPAETSPLLTRETLLTSENLTTNG